MEFRQSLVASEWDENPKIRIGRDTIGTMEVKKQHEKRFSSRGFFSTFVILRKIAYL